MFINSNLLIILKLHCIKTVSIFFKGQIIQSASALTFGWRLSYHINNPRDLGKNHYYDKNACWKNNDKVPH